MVYEEINMTVEEAAKFFKSSIIINNYNITDDELNNIIKSLNENNNIIIIKKLDNYYNLKDKILEKFINSNAYIYLCD